jgi:hypothetical protein
MAEVLAALADDFIVERPIGPINGVNVDFYLRYSPRPDFLPYLVLNGSEQVSESNTFESGVPTARYLMNGNRATFYQAPQPGDTIVAKYWKGTGTILTVASATIHVWTQKLASPYSAFVVGTYFAPDSTTTTVITYANAAYSLRQDTAVGLHGNCYAVRLHRRSGCLLLSMAACSETGRTISRSGIASST